MLRSTKPPAFGTLLALRLANAMLVQTFIHPDETWQSLEVAHRLAFGYGFATWEWQHALRGYAHPMLFACVYELLRVLGLDDTFLLTAAPYALVAAIAASIDYATFFFARRVAGPEVARWALFCSAASWSMSSGVMRPLVNSAETACTAAAFAFWPWTTRASGAAGSLPVALVFAALACIIRPTSGVLWLCAGIVLVARQPHVRWVPRTLRIVGTTTGIGIVAVCAMLLIDRIGYGSWKFPPYQFYVFNVREGLGTWFGESPMLYHLYASMPILFTTMLPYVVHGAWISARSPHGCGEPAVVALLASVMFSLVGHMEYRFLYPLLPIGFVYAAVSISALTGRGSAKHDSKSDSKHDAKPGSKRACPWSAKRVAAFLLVTNIVPALYLDLVHQRGVVDVMKHLRRGARLGTVTDIGFLMPCHSTPFYSHLHANIPMWFLSCEPPLTRAELKSHYWEADDFEQHPREFLHTVFATAAAAKNTTTADGPTTRAKPSHLVLYDAMVRRIHPMLSELGYAEEARFFNTHFSGDARRDGDVVVYQQQQQPSFTKSM
ncbi:glycosylphosphatidylinositol anchor biosynthesis [Coemansia erecta]|nr:glycosylphosphatidylinositol anchor biosynthesis [Coemansia sp. RSA 2618]KAJ2829178.1 glycosylphosphatidylinositol anchor biosynthesis [Coemansia erecta]